MPLNARQIDTAKPKEKEYKLTDGGGLYLLVNGVDQENYLRHVLNVIADWPINRVSGLLPWRITLPTE